MTYKDWKAIYIDKTKTFDAWQKEMEVKYAAMPPTREQLRGREIIDKLSSGAPLTSIKPNDKVSTGVSSSTSQKIYSKSFEELRDYIGKLGNVAVRKWYIYHDKRIHEQIDPNLSMEEKARRAFELRNEYRTQARELMADQEKRRELDEENPNPTWEIILKHKIYDKGMTYEEALEDIYNTATKSNSKVNQILGLE